MLGAELLRKRRTGEITEENRQLALAVRQRRFGPVGRCRNGDRGCRGLEPLHTLAKGTERPG